MWLIFNHDQAKWCTGDKFTVEGKVNAVVTSLFELEALEVHDKVTGEEGSTFWKSNTEVTNDGHAFLVERSTVFINDGNSKLVVTCVFWGKAEAERKSASRVNNWELTCEESIESTLYAEFALIIGSVVTKNSNLSIHNSNVYMRFKVAQRAIGAA